MPIRQASPTDLISRWKEISGNRYAGTTGRGIDFLNSFHASLESCPSLKELQSRCRTPALVRCFLELLFVLERIHATSCLLAEVKAKDKERGRRAIYNLKKAIRDVESLPDRVLRFEYRDRALEHLSRALGMLEPEPKKALGHRPKGSVSAPGMNELTFILSRRLHQIVGTEDWLTIAKLLERFDRAESGVSPANVIVRTRVNGFKKAHPEHLDSILNSHSRRLSKILKSQY